MDHRVNIVRKKFDSIERREVCTKRHCINQRNDNGITDEIARIIVNEHTAQRGLERKIWNRPAIRERSTKQISRSIISLSIFDLKNS